jgi:hypothetical protein
MPEKEVMKLAESSKAEFSKKTSITATKDEKFTLFPKLPTELRLMIWKHALPTDLDEHGRRIITIWPYLAPALNYNSKYKPDLSKFGVIFNPDDLISAACFEVSLLSTCKKSRKVYLEEFKNIRNGPWVVDPRTSDANPRLFDTKILFNDMTTINITVFQDLWLHLVRSKES